MDVGDGVASNRPLAPGEAVSVHETRIPEGIRRRGDGFVAEGDGSRGTLLTRMTDTRGHDLGWIGLTLAGNVKPLDPGPIRDRVRRLTRPDEES